VVGLRRRVSVTVDPKLAQGPARVAILKSNGERSSVFVEHSVGSQENPMSDRMIEDKFLGLVDGILAPPRRARSSMRAGASTRWPMPGRSRGMPRGREWIDDRGGHPSRRFLSQALSDCPTEGRIAATQMLRSAPYSEAQYRPLIRILGIWRVVARPIIDHQYLSATTANFRN